MSVTAQPPWGVLRVSVPSIALIAFSVSVLSLQAAPARVLFPSNLHLSRQIEDPVSGKTYAIEEYCAGNRMVSISADRTVVVDYDKQEITEIDRGAGTYSISRFDEIASAIAVDGGARAAARPQSNGEPDAWKVTPLGLRASAGGRSVEQFEFVHEDAVRQKVEVGVDRSVGLSREAVEVLIGAAYPNPVRDEHEPILRAAAPAAGRDRVATNDVATNDAAAAAYGLPVTQSFTYSDSGTSLTFRTAITRVGAENIPADALIIPPGAKRVESRSSAIQRQLRELDQIAPPSNPREN